MTGRELARIRAKMGLTQAEFGLVAGLATANAHSRRRAVSRWEGSAKVPHNRALLIQAAADGWRPKA